MIDLSIFDKVAKYTESENSQFYIGESHMKDISKSMKCICNCNNFLYNKNYLGKSSMESIIFEKDMYEVGVLPIKCAKCNRYYEIVFEVFDYHEHKVRCNNFPYSDKLNINFDSDNNLENITREFVEICIPSLLNNEGLTIDKIFY